MVAAMQLSAFARRALALTAAIVGLAAGSAVSATPAHAYPDTVWVFKTVQNGRCLDADSNGNGLNGTHVQIWDCYPPSQRQEMWALRPVLSGYGGSAYQLVNQAGGRCLDAPAQRGGTNGTPLQLWDCFIPSSPSVRVPANQVWYVSRNSSTAPYIIKSAWTWRVLDADYWWGGVNGTPIQLWDDYGDGQTNQRWTVGW
jgi:hypothetical protein